jgi:hypothetical protein
MPLERKNACPWPSANSSYGEYENPWEGGYQESPMKNLFSMKNPPGCNDRGDSYNEGAFLPEVMYNLNEKAFLPAEKIDVYFKKRGLEVSKYVGINDIFYKLNIIDINNQKLDLHGMRGSDPRKPVYKDKNGIEWLYDNKELICLDAPQYENKCSESNVLVSIE